MNDKSTTGTATVAAKKPQVPHVDVIRHDVVIFQRIDAADFDAAAAGSKKIAAAIDALKGPTVIIKREAKTAREPKATFDK